MRHLAGAAGVSLYRATIVALCHDHFRVVFETRDCAPKTDSRLPDFAGVNAFGRFPRIGGPRNTKELQEFPWTDRDGPSNLSDYMAPSGNREPW